MEHRLNSHVTMGCNPYMGTGISDYVIGKILGKGAFAFVYEAYSKRSKNHVAIKMIDKCLIQQYNAQERIKMEISIHFGLDHPSIVKLHHYFEDDNYYYLVLELCHKGEMFCYLKGHGRFLDEQIRHYMKQLVEGLEYLHSMGIIHRDLKLSNLLLTHDGLIKIADFGLSAKLSSKTEERYSQLGTPNYVAPEILMKKSHGYSADLWSLGCILYAFLTGRTPFDKPHLRDIYMNIINCEYQLDTEIISEDAKDLVRQLLQKDPKKRIQLCDILNHRFFTPKDITNNDGGGGGGAVSRIQENSHISSSTSSTKSSSTPSSISSGEDSSAGSNYLLPLSTAGLEPIIHETKNAIMEITLDGDVRMKFRKKNLMMIISGDGERITIDKKEKVRLYTFSHLPSQWKYCQHYNFACKFVSTVRSFNNSKPKSTTKTAKGTVLVMCNGDIEVISNNGSRMKFDPFSVKSRNIVPS